MVELLPRLKGIVLRRDFGVLPVSVQAKKGLVTKKDRRAFPRSSPSVAGVLYSDKRTKISAKTGPVRAPY